MDSMLVIADLHLSEQRPDISQCFFDFLIAQQGKHSALYILGDLFESWIGDDDLNAFTLSIAHAIKQFSDSTPVYFIHGNRDFLLNKRYAKRAGMTLLHEAHSIHWAGRTLLFMHGDQLCTDDIEYQAFRKKTRNKWWQWLVTSMPLSWRRKLARKMREQSKQSQMVKTEDIMDVAPQTVNSTMDNFNADWLIHGHTHRPCIHSLANDRIRAVVGDWYEQGSVLIIASDSEQPLTLLTLPFTVSN